MTHGSLLTTLRWLMLALVLASCGGSSSTQPASTVDETTGARPVRIEADEEASGPVRTPSDVPATGDAPLTSDELADPPPVEPP